MPLPWKKTKPNRISRIVADLQPTSRTASLVVETGFPTSVVDLFVKNRDRIKRHSLRKAKHKHSPIHVSESLAPPPTPSISPANSPRLPEHEDVVLIASCSTAGNRVDGLQKEAMPPDVDFNVVCGRPNADSNANADAVNLNYTSTVFVVAAKMFLVVIPVLSTRKLALGITISAFLLFLLEIFGKFAVHNFLNRCSIRNRFFPTTAERGGDVLIGRGGEEEEAPINSALNNEIQIVESNSDDEALGLERESLGNREKGYGGCSDLEVEKEEKQGQFQVGKNEISRRAKLRAKIIKKLIPKKLRSGNRVKTNKKENNKLGIMINENEQGTESSCEEEDEEVWEPEEEEEEIRSSMMRKREEEEEQEQKQKQEERKKSYECKIVIIMILLGLCEGRFLAVVLTVSGCFMFKFIKILLRNGDLGKKCSPVS